MFPSLHPTIEKQFNEIKKTPNSNVKMGRSFLFDFEKGDFVLQDGKVVEIEDIKALEVWIEKIIRTEKFKFKIYDTGNENQYGNTIMELVMGKRLPTQYMIAEIQRQITEALLNHSMIQAITNFKLQKVKSILNINFKVILKDERTFDKEVIL